MKRIQLIIPLSQFFVFFLLLASGCTGTASAKVPVVIPESESSGEKTLSPYFVVISENPETDRLPLKSTKADVNIVGVIADVTIRQTYVNAGKNTLEAIYTFPLSTKVETA